MSADLAAMAAALPADVVAAVDKMAEFKARHGEAFETLIKQKQRDNPKFAFLFDQSSAAHAYYLHRVAQPAAAPGAVGATAMAPTGAIGGMTGISAMPQQMAAGAYPPMQTVAPGMPGMMPGMLMPGVVPQLQGAAQAAAAQLQGAAQAAAAAQLQQQQLHMQAQMAQQYTPEQLQQMAQQYTPEQLQQIAQQQQQIAQQQQHQQALQMQHQQHMMAQQQLVMQQQQIAAQQAAAQQAAAQQAAAYAAQQAAAQQAAAPAPPEKKGPAHTMSVGALASLLHEKRPAGRERTEPFQPLQPHEVPTSEPPKGEVKASVLAAVDIFYAGGKPEVAEKMKRRVRGDNEHERNGDRDRDRDRDRKFS